jgi:cytochrome c556
MRRSLVVAVVLATAAAVGGAALAQNAATIAQRRALLKTMGDSVGPIGPMLRREQPFALEPVQRALATIAATAPQMPPLFPNDARTGDTRALAAIWERKPEFEALFARLGSTATAARAAVVDEASFRAQMPAVLGVCGECHRPFRAAN